MKLTKEAAERLEAYFADEPSQAVIDSMEAWLREDEANPRLFAEYGLIDRLISHEQKNQDASAIFASLLEAEEAAVPIVLDTPDWQTTNIDQQPSDAITFKQACAALSYLARQSLRNKAGQLVGIAAVLLLAVVVVFVFRSGLNDTPQSDPIASDNTPAKPAEPAPPILRDTPGTTTVATLTATHNAQWAQHSAEGASAPGSQKPLTPGSKLNPNQRLTLTAGFAEITTNDGAIAILEAPATVELLNNNNALRLHTGKLVGICETKSSKGFVVKTDYADIVDIGTEFGVEVTDAGVQTTVFVGEVEIQTSTGSIQHLTHDQTARLAINDSSRELVIEDRVAENFVRSMPAMAPLAITDDFDSAHPFDPAAGLGWAGPWQTEVDKMMGLTLNTIAGQPLASASGRYLEAVFKSENPRALGSFIRRFDRYETVDRTKPHRISFLLRVDDSFVPSEPFDQRISVFDNTKMQQGTSNSNTWMIGAFGFPQGTTASDQAIGELNVGSWSWSYFDGDVNGDVDATGASPMDLSKLKDTGVPLVPEQTYAIQITVDPEASSWDLVIVSGDQRFDSREVLGRSIRFRSNATEAGGQLHFAVRNSKTGSENRVQIDEIQIEPITSRTRTLEN